MNFLAHALLAGDAAADRVGGLMGDFIKGPLPAQLPPALAAGVALHRAIDSFAERHEAFVRSRARISATRRRVAGVLVDLFYDHLLAGTWASYCQTPLPAYAARMYTLLADFKAALPEKARDVADRMQAQDWLSAYQHVDAVGQAIDRMAIYRIRRANPLAGGIEEFLADPDGFARDFQAFMPAALAFTVAWRVQRTAASG